MLKDEKFLVYPIHKISQNKILYNLWKINKVIICPVCGKISKIEINSDNLRETCSCSHCNSTNRQRQIAYCLCVYASSKGSKVNSLNQINNISIYNTESRGALHSNMLHLDQYYCSEFFGSQYDSGAIIDNIENQDLMNLSYKNNSFDVVLSSDVFEHIPDPYVAHKEVYRVLKTGGVHIFTVPFNQNKFQDEILAQTVDGQTIYYNENPIYHNDPIHSDGALVYTIFSIEMLVKLSQIGFTTKMYALNAPSKGILGNNAIVFMAYK